ncbi:MAG: hypothetical protein ICCCNLDF_00897 [Planctomycetes bacterium]|nr:hypothetical protein [Planctomycetota bacterium]
MPLPVPVLTVTLRVFPDPLTPVTEAPETPTANSVKFPVVTPVTVSLKVTVKPTELRPVGLELARTMLDTTGRVLSIVTTVPPV